MNDKSPFASSEPPSGSGHPGPSIAVLAQVSEALRDLRYGQVTVIVQDGAVVQIDRLEKHRLARELR